VILARFERPLVKRSNGGQNYQTMAGFGDEVWRVGGGSPLEVRVSRLSKEKRKFFFKAL